MEIGRYMQICKWLIVLFIFFNGLSYAEEKLQPTIQINNVSDLVYEIKTKELLPYLSKMIIMQNKDLNDIPHIIGLGIGKDIATENDFIYVKGLHSQENTIFNVVSFGSIIKDPVSKEYFGSTVEITGMAKLLEFNKVSQLKVTAAYRDMQIGYAVIPSINFDLPEILYATYPKNAIQGKILTGLNGLNNQGNYDTVIINLGTQDKLVVGNLLNIMQANRVVIDSSNKRKNLENLPGRKIGEILVYRVYDKLSLGLILNAEAPVQDLDTVTN